MPFRKKASVYDQEISQSHSTAYPMAPRRRDKENCEVMPFDLVDQMQREYYMKCIQSSKRFYP